MTIQPIVEGYGDVEAVPVLLRRLIDEAQAWEVGVGRSIRRRRNQLREYEAWFLSSVESLRGVRGIRSDAAFHAEPEAPRNAKGQLEQRMRSGSSYFERDDQPALSARFALPDAHHRCRSFRKLTNAFGTLVRAMGVEMACWPPAAWGGHR